MNEKRLQPDITIRVPKLGLEDGFERYWHGGDPVATHAFNALSFLFPQGERFFIDKAKEVYKNTQIDNKELVKEIHKFIAQEKIHTSEHEIYNTILESQGYRNLSEAYFEKMEESVNKRFSSLHNLAMVAAFEHYTAILSDWILTYPEALENADEKMKLLWGWHSIEEIEHKSVCYDLYQEAGGGWWMRVKTFLLVTHYLRSSYVRNFWGALKHDGLLKRPHVFKTIVQILKFYTKKHGVGRHLISSMFSYLKPNFTPWQHDNRDKLYKWIKNNEHKLF